LNVAVHHDQYLSYDDYVSWFKSLRKRHQVFNITSIGKSVEGRGLK
jgi:hypothetical protein